jgi:hypothetical protein
MDTAHLTAWVDLCWRLIPLETPCIIRRCAHCNAARRFASTGKFRLNAQQRHLDVWLLYRCVACDATWKHPVFERCAPEDIGDDLHARLLQNDAETARTYAFDVAALRRGGAQVDEAVPFRVEASPLEYAPTVCGWRITLELSLPCSVRLDRLLVHSLGVSRTQVHRWATDRSLAVVPGDHRALKRPVRHGQVVLIRSEAVGPPHNAGRIASRS